MDLILIILILLLLFGGAPGRDWHRRHSLADPDPLFDLRTRQGVSGVTH
jgi:hypothetical protein